MTYTHSTDQLKTIILEKDPTIVIRSLMNMAARAGSVDKMEDGCNMPICILGIGLVQVKVGSINSESF